MFQHSNHMSDCSVKFVNETRTLEIMYISAQELWPQYTDIGLLQRLQGSSCTLHLLMRLLYRTMELQVPYTNEIHMTPCSNTLIT